MPKLTVDTSRTEDGEHSGQGARATADGPTMTESALLRLHLRYRRVLVAYARRYTLGSHHDAEDLVQEALLRAWQHPKIVGDPEVSPLPWLRKVIRNLAIDRLRAQGCRPVTTTDEGVAALPAAADAADDLLTSLVVREAMETLKPIHRAVLVERFIAGSSISDVSNRLGVPPGTVKSRCYHGMRALRAALARRGLAEPVPDRTGPVVRPAASVWTAGKARRSQYEIAGDNRLSA